MGGADILGTKQNVSPLQLLVAKSDEYPVGLVYKRIWLRLCSMKTDRQKETGSSKCGFQKLEQKTKAFNFFHPSKEADGLLHQCFTVRFVLVFSLHSSFSMAANDCCRRRQNPEYLRSLLFATWTSVFD